MMRTPDGHSRLELSRFLTPPAVADHRNAPGTLSATYASCSPWTTWTIRSRGSASSARSSSSELVHTKTCIGSATSGGPKVSHRARPRTRLETGQRTLDFRASLPSPNRRGHVVPWVEIRDDRPPVVECPGLGSSADATAARRLHGPDGWLREPARAATGRGARNRSDLFHRRRRSDERDVAAAACEADASQLDSNRSSRRPKFLCTSTSPTTTNLSTSITPCS